MNNYDGDKLEHVGKETGLIRNTESNNLPDGSHVLGGYKNFKLDANKPECAFKEENLEPNHVNKNGNNYSEQEKSRLSKMKRFIFLLLVIVLVGTVYSVNMLREKTPDEVVNILMDGILKAQEKGNYNCCIEPPCTMCYLGKWKFEKGTCYCDDAIAEGRFDDVCPECGAGSEQKVCSSRAT